MIGGSSIRLGSGGSGAGLGFQRAAAGGATNQQPRKCQASDQGGGFDSRARSFPLLLNHYHRICILEGVYVLGVLIVMIHYYTLYIYDYAPLHTCIAVTFSIFIYPTPHFKTLVPNHCNLIKAAPKQSNSRNDVYNSCNKQIQSNKQHSSSFWKMGQRI